MGFPMVSGGFPWNSIEKPWVFLWFLIEIYTKNTFFNGFAEGEKELLKRTEENFFFDLVGFKRVSFLFEKEKEGEEMIASRPSRFRVSGAPLWRCLKQRSAAVVEGGRWCVLPEKEDLGGERTWAQDVFDFLVFFLVFGFCFGLRWERWSKWRLD